MRVLAAFLGTGKYEKVQYRKDEFLSDSVVYIQTAAAQYFEYLGTPVDRLFIFATKEAEEKHKNDLCDEVRRILGTGVKLDFFAVKGGLDDREIADIFSVLNTELKRHISADDTVVWDVTHGFRVQPILAMFAMNYLERLPTAVKLEDIVYGVFDRDLKQSGVEEFPLVSLHSLWKLHEWAQAFGAFREYGYTAPLARLFEDQRNEDARRQKDLAHSERRYVEFGGLAGLLTSFDDAVKTNNIPSLFGTSEQGRQRRINAIVDALSVEWGDKENEVGEYIAPFVEEFRDILAPMVTQGRWDDSSGLKAQLAYIEWLYGHRHYANVVTVMREWFVTYFYNLLVICGYSLTRDEADGIFGAYPVYLGNPQKVYGTKKVLTEVLRERIRAVDDMLKQFELREDVAANLSQLTEVRNAINHASSGKNTLSVSGGVETVSRSIEGILAYMRLALDALLE